MRANAHGAQAQLFDSTGEAVSALRGFAFSSQRQDLGVLLSHAIELARRDGVSGCEAAVPPAHAACTVMVDGERLQQALAMVLGQAASGGDSPLRLFTHLGAAGLEIRIPRAGAGLRPFVLADGPVPSCALRKAEERVLVARRLLEAQGATLLLRGSPGRTPTVLIRLPKERFSKPLPAYRQSFLAHDGPRNFTRNALESVHVLLVEDDPDALDFLTLILQQAGARVSAFGMAEPALHCHTSCEPTPDVVVSDIAMPGQDGYTLMRRLRAWEREQGKVPVPAIAVSAFARAEDVQRSVANGFDQHIAKPIDAQQLLEEIVLWTR